MSFFFCSRKVFFPIVHPLHIKRQSISFPLFTLKFVACLPAFTSLFSHFRGPQFHQSQLISGPGQSIPSEMAFSGAEWVCNKAGGRNQSYNKDIIRQSAYEGLLCVRESKKCKASWRSTNKTMKQSLNTLGLCLLTFGSVCE